MERYANLTIIGTSHISPESVELVRKTILLEKPTIVAVELDTRRYYHLISKDKEKVSPLQAIKTVGFTGFLVTLLGAWAEKKLSELTGSSPGTEMLSAIKAAKKTDATVAFIDRDIAITLKRLSQKITTKEKFTFLWDLITSPFKRKKISFDLNKVPSEELISTLMIELRKKYPHVYAVLIKERDEYMAKVLNKLKQNDTKIIAVVGAGHEKGIIKYLQKLEGS